MKYILTDTYGNETIFENAVSITLDMEEDAPAHGLKAAFACDFCDKDFCTVRVEDENGCIFNGIVDEQAEIQSINAVLLEITARSLAALLLDNEAVPQTYHLPSMGVIFERHLKPLGFEKYIGSDKSFGGEMTVAKGMSEWSVLSMFAGRFLGVVPKILEDGTVDVSGELPEKTVVLSGGSMKIRRVKKRCKLISQVNSRGRSGAGYEIVTLNPLAQALGVGRRRCVNAATAVDTSVSAGDKLIQNGNAAYEHIEIICPDKLLYPLGTLIVANGTGKGRLTALRYHKDINGETTTLTVGINN